MRFARRLTFSSIDSTNNYAKNHSSLPHFSLIRARFQTAGRGQFDRQWIAEPNQNFLLSIVWKKGLTLIKIKSIERALIQGTLSFLKDVFHIHAYHKMPNDIYVGTKKIAGFLIESVIQEDHVQSLIIGIGLNVNQTNFPNGLSATSIALLIGKRVAIDRTFEIFITTIKPLLSSI